MPYGRRTRAAAAAAAATHVAGHGGTGGAGGRRQTEPDPLFPVYRHRRAAITDMHILGSAFRRACVPLSQPCLTDRRCTTEEPAHSRPTCQCPAGPRQKCPWQGLSSALASSSLGPRLVLVLPRFTSFYLVLSYLVLQRQARASSSGTADCITYISSGPLAPRWAPLGLQSVRYYVMWVLLQR